MADGPSSADLAEAARKRGIEIAPREMPAVLAGARWLQQSMALLRKADLSN
jgi:hypothetical protein